MDKLARMRDITLRLTAATTHRDWSGLARIDQELAQFLSGQGRIAGWSRAEQSAVQALQDVHRAALRSCSDEMAVLKDKLAGMHAHKDGWQAYALSEAWQECQT